MKQYLSSLKETIQTTFGLLKQLRPLRWHLIWALFLAATQGAAISVVLGQSYQNILDSAQKTNSIPLSNALIGYGLAILSVALIWGWMESYCNFRTKAKVSIILRRNLLHQLLATDKRTIEQWTSADLEKRYTQDIDRAAQFICRGLNSQILCPLIEGGVSAVFLAFLHPALLITAFLVGVVVFILQSKLIAPTSEYSDKITTAQGELSSCIHDIILDLPVIRLFFVGSNFDRKARNICDKIYQLKVGKIKFDLAVSSLELLLRSIQDIAFVIVGGLLISRASITFGALLAAMNYSVSVMGIFEAVSGGISRVQTNRAGARSLLNLLESAKAEESSTTAPKQNDLQNETLLFTQNLSVYFDNKVLLNNVNFEIKEGQQIILTGPSGCGKSTLAKIFANLYTASAGDLRLKSREICYVPSNGHIFCGTVRDNIALFQTNVTDQSILDILDNLSLKKWFESLSDGLDTILINNGDTLSGGEAQRLMIARALLKPARLYIFDEPTSALDESSRDSVVRALTALKSRNSSASQIIITHDPSIWIAADGVCQITNNTLIKNVVTCNS